MTPTDSLGPPPPRRRARSWRLRLGLGAVALVVIAIAVFAWLLETARQGKLTVRLIEFGNRELARSSNLRVYASRLTVRGGTVDIDTLRVDGREGGRWYRLLDATRARVQADVQALALRRPQVYDIRLFSPVVHLVTAENGRAVLPQFRSTRSGGGGGRDGFHITLEGARVRAHARGDSTEWWEDGGLVARVRPEGRGYDLSLDHATGRCPPLGLEFLSATGHAWAAADTVRLTEFFARTDAGAARLSGTLEGRRLAGQFRADGWPWEFFGDLLEQPALDVPGEVSVRGAVLGTVDRPEFRTLLTGHWRSEAFEGVIDGRIVERGLAVSRADLGWRDARFAGTAEFAKAGRWSIAGRVSGLDLAQVEHLFPGAVLPTSQLTGPARIQGSEGTLLVSAEGLSGSLMDLPLASVGGTWRIVGRRHAVLANGTVAGGALTLGGGWDDQSVSLSGTASHADLSRFGTWIPALRGAAGELEETKWSVVGPARSPRLTVDGRVAAARFPPLDAQAVRFRYDGTWSKTPAGSARVEISSLAAYGWRADTAWAQVRHVGRDVTLAPIQIESGDTTLYGVVEVLPQGEGWRVRADSVRLESPKGWIQSVGPVELESVGGQWRIHHLSLAGSVGHLEVTGWAQNQDDLDLQVSGRGLGAAQLAETVGLRGWAGELGFDAHLAGGGGRRQLDLNLTAEHLITPTFRSDNATALLKLSESGGTLTVDKLHLELGKSTVDGSGQARLADGKWPLDPTHWLAEIRRASQWRGEVSVRAFDLVDLSAVWPRLDWLAGHVTGTARLGGRPAQPEGETEGSVPDLFIHGHPVDPVSWRARYGESSLSIEDLRIGLGDSAATVRGTFPLDLAWETAGGRRVPDRPMDLTVQASRVSLGEAATFLPFVAYADGTLAANLRILGRPGHVRPTGTLDVHGGHVRFTGREEVYGDLQARLVFDSTLVRIENLQASQGKDGKLTGGGTVTLGERGVDRYDLNVKAVNALALASGEYEARFDGSFHVTEGPRLGDAWFPLPHVQGDLHVRDGVILYDFADPANRVYFAGPKQAPAWVYDVDVTAPNQLYWRTPNANVELKGDLTVSQTVDDWRVWGTVESLNGTYYFLENKFRVDTGTLTFDQIEPMNPKIDATAHTDVTGIAGTEQVTITLTLSGRVRTPTVRLSSTPAYSEQEIVGLLTIGRLRFASGNAGVLVGTTGGQYLLRQLARQFPEISPILGDVELGNTPVQTPTGVYVMPSVILRRYFTPELNLRYSQVLGTPTTTGASGLNVRDLGAEYRISRIFYLTGEILERRTGGSLTPAASQSELEYNLDLRARYVY